MTELEKARRIAVAMRDGESTNGDSYRGLAIPFHRQGSPYGHLQFNRDECAEAGRLFLSLLSKLKDRSEAVPERRSRNRRRAHD